MSEHHFSVGDRVLASRAQDGENHEEATVVDSYSLLIGPVTTPMVAVTFDDGERVYLTATEPDVLPLPEPEAAEAEGVEAEEDSPGEL